MGLMSVTLGVIFAAVVTDVPVKFYASLSAGVRCASAQCHTVHPIINILSGSFIQAAIMNAVV